MRKIEANIVRGKGQATIYENDTCIGRVLEKAPAMYRAYIPVSGRYTPISPSYTTLREAIDALAAIHEGTKLD